MEPSGLEAVQLDIVIKIKTRQCTYLLSELMEANYLPWWCSSGFPKTEP